MPVYKTAWYRIPEDCQHYYDDFRHCLYKTCFTSVVGERWAI